MDGFCNRLLTLTSGWACGGACCWGGADGAGAGVAGGAGAGAGNGAAGGAGTCGGTPLALGGGRLICTFLSFITDSRVRRPSGSESQILQTVKHCKKECGRKLWNGQLVWYLS